MQTHLVRRLGVESLQLEIRANLPDAVRGVLSTRSQRRSRRSRSTEDREEDGVEELVELHLVESESCKCECWSAERLS